jgi:predicted nucleotidyltransferase
MLETLIAYLRNEFEPGAIVLHGSRARGMERVHSDWDFILLYEEGKLMPANGRRLYDGQNIEFVVSAVPLVSVVDSFDIKLREAKVVYETNGIGALLLEQANKEYEQGLSWSDDKKAAHKLWIEGRIDGMRDCIDEPLFFYKYFADFYSRVFNYWYWLKKDDYSQPIYVAIEDLEKEDSKYLALIEDVLRQESLEAKVEVCEKIKVYLFDETAL